MCLFVCVFLINIGNPSIETRNFYFPRIWDKIFAFYRLNFKYSYEILEKVQIERESKCFHVIKHRRFATKNAQRKLFFTPVNQMLVFFTVILNALHFLVES